MTTNIAADVPTLADIEDAADDLLGLDEDIDRMVRAAIRIATRPLTVDQTASLMVGLAGAGPSVIQLIAALIARLGAPATNYALRDLRDGTAKQISDLTAELVADLTGWLPTDNVDEAAALIHQKS